ncbi:MAG: glycosyltransferase family 2 protein [Armatimonadetes bacterium]|nr:glycosyltransferase family 2 protein [Armatimonadota bacterium]
MSQNRPEVSVIMPALNEENTIREVVSRVLAVPLSVQVIVIDDGSTDRTPEILAEFGDKIIFLQNAKPGGKGAAIRKGLPYATGKVTIIQDADLEYLPEELPQVVAPILSGHETVVYGTRFAHGLPPKMALPNKIVNVLLALSVRLLFFRRMTDEATCYKAFSTDLLQGMDLQCTRFEFCPEVTAKAFRMGQHIAEVPISYTPRTTLEGKKIKWTDAPQAFWTLFRYRFWRPSADPAAVRAASKAT